MNEFKRYTFAMDEDTMLRFKKAIAKVQATSDKPEVVNVSGTIRSGVLFYIQEVEKDNAPPF